jgi:hypothetical protein
MSLISTQMVCHSIKILRNISPEDFAHHVHHATCWNDLGIRLGFKPGFDGQIKNYKMVAYLRQKVINMGLNVEHFRRNFQGVNDDDFIKFVKEGHCLYQVAQKCISSGDINRHYDYYIMRIKELCIDTSHWKKRKSSMMTMDDETLKMNVKNSTTWSDFYRKCKCNGGRIIKKADFLERIKMLGLDTDHFRSRGHQRRPEEKLFVVEGKLTDAKEVKKRLVRDLDRPYECSKCKNKNFTERDGVLMWEDQEIVLQLEHKNGVNTDNRPQNLEFLCPNCHSQTSTYGGRNCKKIKLMKEWVEDGKKNE